MADDPTHEAPGALDDFEQGVTARPTVWPFALGFAALLVLAGAVVALWPDPVQPYRVLVAVDGVDEDAADRAVSAVRGPLGVGGLRVLTIAGGPPPSDDASMLAAAHEARAMHAVLIRIEVLESRPRGTIDPAYARVSASASVGEVNDEGSGGGAIVRVPPVEMSAFGEEEPDALGEAVADAVAALTDAIHLAIMRRDAIAAFLENTRVDNDELEAQSAMRSAHARVEPLTRELDYMRESCEAATSALTDDRGAAAVHCVSGPCAEEYAFDVLPDGSAALVYDETPSVRVPLVGDRAVAERVEAVERIELVPLDGGPRRVLATSRNYSCYPAMSGDGTRVAYVEQWPRYGFGVSIVDVDTAQRTALARFEVLVSQIALSHDGSRLLASLRPRRRGPSQLVTMRTEPGAQLTSLGEAYLARWVRVARPGADAVDDLVAELVAVSPPDEPLGEIDDGAGDDAASDDGAPDDAASDGEEADSEEPDAEAGGELPALGLDRQLALLDPNDGSILAQMDDDIHHVREVIGERDGAIHFRWTNHRVCGLGRWTPATDERAFVQTQTCLRYARLLSGDRAVGTATLTREGDPSADDAEIAVASWSDGSVQALTSNALRERYPRATAGDRVVFDRLGAARYREFPRVALCWLDAP
ncbi:MAG: hypothetical protein AB7S26_16590 [Sandaracinaceae bacterium]